MAGSYKAAGIVALIGLVLNVGDVLTGGPFVWWGWLPTVAFAGVYFYGQSQGSRADAEWSD